MTDAWRSSAACRGVPVSVFYSEDQSDYREARAICRRCSVWRECRDEAMAERDWHGFRGGLSPRERVRLDRNYRNNERRTRALLREERAS